MRYAFFFVIFIFNFDFLFQYAFRNSTRIHQAESHDLKKTPPDKLNQPIDLHKLPNITCKTPYDRADLPCEVVKFITIVDFNFREWPLRWGLIMKFITSGIATRYPLGVD